MQIEVSPGHVGDMEKSIDTRLSEVVYTGKLNEKWQDVNRQAAGFLKRSLWGRFRRLELLNEDLRRVRHASVKRLASPDQILKRLDELEELNRQL